MKKIKSCKNYKRYRSYGFLDVTELKNKIVFSYVGNMHCTIKDVNECIENLYDEKPENVFKRLRKRKRYLKDIEEGCPNYYWTRTFYYI